MFYIILLASSLVLGAHSSNQSPCLDGFTLSSQQTTCFKLENNTVPWGAARDSCRQLGDQNTAVDLVRFHSVEEEKDARQRFPVDAWSYWIGVNDVVEEGRYVWLDEDLPTEYTNWMVDQPVASDSLNCVVDIEGKWSSLVCQTNQLYVCGHKPRVVEASTERCQAGWEQFGDLGCVLVDKEVKRTWNESRINCQKHGADLMVVPSQAVHRHVKDLLHSQNKLRFWIGLSERQNGSLAWNDHDYKWTDEKDSKSAPSDRFLSHTSKVAGNKCVVTLPWKGSRWDTEDCNELHFSVCMPHEMINAVLQLDATTIDETQSVNEVIDDQESTLSPVMDMSDEEDRSSIPNEDGVLTTPAESISFGREVGAEEEFGISSEDMDTSGGIELVDLEAENGIGSEGEEMELAFVDETVEFGPEGEETEPSFVDETVEFEPETEIGTVGDEIGSPDMNPSVDARVGNDNVAV